VQRSRSQLGPDSPIGILRDAGSILIDGFNVSSFAVCLVSLALVIAGGPTSQQCGKA
jgi:hypothetical protein